MGLVWCPQLESPARATFRWPAASADHMHHHSPYLHIESTRLALVAALLAPVILLAETPRFTINCGGSAAAPFTADATAVFDRCEMDAKFLPAGWHNWVNAENENTARYYEFGSTGPGARPDQRVNWAKNTNRCRSREVERPRHPRRRRRLEARPLTIFTRNNPIFQGL